MAKFSTIARPYALAAFDYAHAKQQLSAWKSFLELAATIAKHPTVIKLLVNPQVSTEKLVDLFQHILALQQFNAEQKNFLLLLAQNKRLMLLPEVNELFKLYEAALEKISTVRVITAVEMESAYKQKLAQSLTKRIQHSVTLKCEINPAILGGAVIHIGDNVIDGSVRGKLNRLLQDLTRY